MDFEEELNRAVRPSPTLLAYPLQDGWPREVWGALRARSDTTVRGWGNPFSCAFLYLCFARFFPR